MIERYEYDAYGRVSMFDGSYSPIASSAIGNTRFFTSQEYDAETAQVWG